LVLGACLIAGVACGCGVTTQDRPVRMDPDDVPFELLEDRPPAEPEPTATTSR
jgi:hypothetical protein